MTNADNIYVMKLGQVVESGTHDNLYSNQDEYYKMITRQKELENAREVC